MEQTIRWSPAHHYTPSPQVDPAAAASPGHERLRLVIIQETPGVWLVRGLEHDVAVEGRSIGTAVRAADRLRPGPHRLRQASRSDAALRLSSLAFKLLECVWRRVARGAQPARGSTRPLDGTSARPSPTAAHSRRAVCARVRCESRELCKSDVALQVTDEVAFAGARLN